MTNKLIYTLIYCLVGFGVLLFGATFSSAQTVGQWSDVGGGSCDAAGTRNDYLETPSNPPNGGSYITCIYASSDRTEPFDLPLSGLITGSEYRITVQSANFGIENFNPGHWVITSGGTNIGSTQTLAIGPDWFEDNITFTATGSSQTLRFSPIPDSSPIVWNAAMSISTSFSLMSTNARPTISGVPSSVTVVEDTLSNVNLGNVSFADADGDTLTVNLTASAGTFSSPTSSGSVTASRPSTNVIRLVGTAGNINSWLDNTANVKYTTATDASGTGVATLTISASDGTVGLSSNPTVSINSTATPDVTSVSSSTANGYYNLGDTVAVQVNFDMAVTVSGTPTLTLETGATDRAVSYTSGSGGSTLSFTYTVQAGDTSQDLDYTSTSALAGTITGNGYAADRTLASPGASGSLRANKAIVIDTTAPVVSDAQISLSGATGTGGVFKVGDTVTVSWDTSGSDGDTNLSASLGSVSVDFSAFGGGSAVSASLSGSTWSATYTIAAGTSTTGSSLDVSLTATDAAGNVTTQADTTGATVDATPPVVTAANISISGASGTGGAYKIGDTVTATWDNTSSGDNNADIASATINFTQFGGGAAVSATNSGGTWTATYTIVAGSIDATSRNVSVSAIDTAGNVTTTADTTNATVDNVAPTVTAGKITVSGATGNPSNTVFKIGDTVSVSWNDTGAGDNNADTISTVTVDFSDFGGGTAVSATNSSGTWTATYVYTAGQVAGSTYHVAVTSTDNAGNVTTTTDDAALSLDNVDTASPAGIVLNNASNSGSTTDTITNVTKPVISGTSEPNATVTIYVDGVAVGTTTADGTGAWSYTFPTALAEGNRSITTTATDYVGNTSAQSSALVLTIDTTPPTQPPAPLLDDASNTGVAGDLITYNTTPGLHGTAEANAVVEVFVAGTSVGTAQADGSGNWSFTLPDGALSEGANDITVTATDAAANTSGASTALTLTLDTTDPFITITDPLMGDNRFNATEATAVTLLGTTTGVEDGQTVTLSVGDGATTLPFTTTVSGNAWTKTVDLSSLTDGALTITADVTDVAGNAATQASHTITKDIVLPTATVTGPTEVQTGVFDVTITFSEAVYGFDREDVTVVQGTATALTGSGTTYTVTIDPVMGQIVQVSVAAGVAADIAGNPNTASNVYEVQAGSPASEFERHEEEIRQIIVDEAERSLRSTMTTNRRMVVSARDRFIDKLRQRDQGDATRNNVALDVDGGFNLSDGRLSTSGTFFQQHDIGAGTYQRLVFGDFDIQHDSDTGSSTATLSGKVAWERLAGERALLGGYLGGDLAHSTIDGEFAGNNTRLGVSAGGYAVYRLAEKLYLDGHLSYGAGRNNLEMANDVLALDSDYTTRTATFSAALTGVYEYERYELRPELAFSYGKTWLGNIRFTGRAYGLVDDTLSLDAGSVSVANLTLRPEVIWALDATTVANSNAKLSFAPRLICERLVATVQSKDCGAGAEIGLSRHSENGLSLIEVNAVMDRVGNSTRSTLAFNFEHKF